MLGVMAFHKRECLWLLNGILIVVISNADVIFVFTIVKIHFRDTMVASNLIVAGYINERAVISIWKMPKD